MANMTRLGLYMQMRLDSAARRVHRVGRIVGVRRSGQLLCSPWSVA